MEEIKVRGIEAGDAEGVSEIICRNLIEVNSRDYTPCEIDRYIEHFTPETIVRLAREREMLVAECAGGVVGTGSLGTFGDAVEDNWTVFTVFVKTDCHGRGIGRILMEEIEKLARSKGVSELTVPSGITACDFYKKLGYNEVEYLEDKKIHLMKKIL